MASTTAQKLKLKEGSTLLTVNAPKTFKASLGPLPAGVRISREGKDYNQVHWFVIDREQMERELKQVLKLVKGDVLLWIYYPKGSSKLQTDLTRDKGWDSLLRHDGLTWISLISFDKTWSTFGARLKTSTDKKKEQQPKEREIFNWVNPQTKQVRLPADLKAAFEQNKKQAEFFESLSFTNKKEYLEWVITAKREETRNERIAGTIERLARNWKNPRNI